MQEQIQQNLENPKALEELYRKNKNAFKKSFNEVYTHIKDQPIANYWYERLNYPSHSINFGSNNEILMALGLCIISGLLAKIPFFFGIEPDVFYQKNIGFIVFPSLMILYAKINQIEIKRIGFLLLIPILAALFMNWVPFDINGDTVILSSTHLLLVLWFVLGFVFIGGERKNNLKRIDFLKFNGDLIVMGTVIVLAGIALTLVTVGLFSLINITLEEFFFENMAIWGLSAVPIVAAYLIHQNPDLVKNVSPIIAKIFTPLVLVMLVFFLIALIFTGQDPFNDRTSLLIFNLLLIGVMAIILFSVVTNGYGKSNFYSNLLLFTVAILTIIINGIALSAIIFRISEWGFTPNRLVILGSNVLILIHLLQVTYAIFISLKKSNEDSSVPHAIASYLPIYAIWALIVTFIFPLIFNFN